MVGYPGRHFKLAEELDRAWSFFTSAVALPASTRLTTHHITWNQLAHKQDATTTESSTNRAILV
jgi:hypothetical protein